MKVENLTQDDRCHEGQAFANPDTSSAEWVAETPSLCATRGYCRTVTLSDFGDVTFTNASATAGGHTGSISDRALDGHRDPARPGARRPRLRPLRRRVRVRPGGRCRALLAARGSSFSVKSRLSTAAAPPPGLQLAVVENPRARQPRLRHVELHALAVEHGHDPKHFRYRRRSGPVGLRIGARFRVAFEAMELPLSSAEPSRLLPLADALGILTFATVGLLSHDHALSFTGYARDALPLLVGWFAAAFLFGAYRNPSPRTLLATWIVGVPLGILVRALVLGRSFDGDQAVFLGITLAFTLLFVLAFRGVLGLAMRR